MLRSLFFLLTFYPWTMLVALLALPITLLGENAVHNWGAFWGRSCLWLAGVRLRVQGAEHLPRDRSVVFVVNHQSNFDIPALYAGLPLQFRWMAKKELFSIPLFGLAMARCGYIPIERGDRRKAMHSIIEAARRIAAGTSVVVFPEGTRSPDGRLQEFKKGGFVIAVKAEVPLVPLAIRGTRQVLPKGSWLVRSAPVELQIFPAVETAGLKNADIDTLLEQVRAPIAKALEGAAANDHAA